MGRTARVACAITALVLTTAVSACGGDDERGAAPASDPTALPSPSSHTTETAQHFIRRWAAATARMETTGKTGPYLALARECGSCRELAHNIARRYAAGGYVRWGGLRIDSVEVPPNAGDAVLYTVHAHSAPMTLRDSSSRPAQRLAGRQVTYLVGVRSGSRGYVVTSVTYG